MLVLAFNVNALDVTINEIMYDPAAEMGDDSDFEYVELFNPLDTSVNLSGWKLDCAGMLTTIANVEITSRDYLVIARELEDGTAADTDCFLCYYGFMPNAIDGLG